MKPEKIEQLLRDVAEGRCRVDDAMTALRNWPVEDLGFARIDHHRHLRRGVPEVVFAAGKRPEETERIAQAMVASGSELLVTRADEETLARLERRFPTGRVNRIARTFVLTGREAHAPDAGEGLIAILAAGTSDMPVAEEAAETARALGARVETIVDVGVAGLHRLVPHLELVRRAHVVVAVAGMEGALPTVVAGLVQSLVIAVPTSVGYGASLGGFAALLAMLNSCAAGVVVVNIDNGFGAGLSAALVNRSVLAAAKTSQSE